MSFGLVRNSKFLCNFFIGRKIQNINISQFPRKSKPSKRKTKGICFGTVKRNEYFKAVEFMQKYFLDDPFVLAHSVNRDQETCLAFGYTWISMLEQGYSLKLSEPVKKDIAAISLNCNHYQQKAISETLTIANMVNSPPLKNLFKSYATLASEPNLGIQKNKPIYEISWIAVNKKYRKQGLAEELIIKSLYYARNKGFKYARIDCTSPHTAKISARNDFVLVWEKPYKAFLGPKAKTSKGDVVKVFVKDLSQLKKM